MSRCTAVSIAAVLLIGCASMPTHDSGWKACWVGEWIACK
jgi:hypothetical protein